ncbi:class I SAM-dependent methyltransferase [Streptomyces sp. Da 82-17]|uniref:class I SAM-dependent methyltransferase n=1 Tax=Streptomyces sp. Da 82-17 TaxID=3377116 RepID=UPI0038D4F2A5
MDRHHQQTAHPRGSDHSHGAPRVYDDERLAGAYERGNEMPEPSLRAWVELIASRTDRPQPAVVEVGAGTGMFSAAMARWIDGAEVLAVDASEAMLAEARRHHPHPAVRYERGSAEHIPAAQHSFDLALLSRVVHHLPDRAAAARELARVLRPGGKAIVRTTFRERLDAVVYDYWPRLRALDERRFPSEQQLVADFTSAGFVREDVLSYAQPVAPDLATYHARVATAPQSKFTYLTPEEFRAGLDRMEAAVRREAADRASGAAPREEVNERYDVAVFTLPGSGEGRSG